MDAEQNDQLYTDIQCFNNFTEEQVQEIVDLTTEAIINKSGSLLDTVSAYAEREKLELPAVKCAIRGFFSVMKEGIKSSYNAQRLYNALVNYGLTPQRSRCVSAIWGRKQTQLVQAVADHTIEVNHLEDFQWRFGVIASGGSGAFLKLCLTVNNGEKKENVHMEMSLNQFYEFLHQMEIAKQYLDYY